MIRPRPPAATLSSDDELHGSRSSNRIATRPIVANGDKASRQSDFLRLDHYDVDHHDEQSMIADDDFFKNQHTPSRSSVSSRLSDAKVERVGMDKTPIMLMKQINRLSVN